MSFAANPRADNPQEGGREAIGAVTSDSLAAQSMREGGGFSENENAHEMGVKGSNSTFNTTDTSGATALHPARDGATREKQDAMGLGADEKGVTGLKYPDAAGQPRFDGAHSDQGFAAGPGNSSSGYNTTTGGTYSGASGDSFVDGGAGITGSSSAKTSGISSGSGSTAQGSSQTDTTSYSGGGNGGSGNHRNTNPSSAGRGDGPLVTGGAGEDFGTASRPGQDTAPNYAATISGAIQSEGQYKPKGSNLTEGDIPQTKTFTGDVGGQHDPGRAAEQGFQKVSAENSASAGPPKYSGSGQDSSTGGQFDALKTERAPDRNY